MDKYPAISIILITYNRGYCIDRAIKSVINQTYQDWELLIVDNNSEDDTDFVVNSFKDPRISLHKINNEGIIAKSRNFGIKHALGKYIAFLDSDDWWDKEKLSISIKYLNKNYDIVYHDLFKITTLKDEMSFFKKTVKARDLQKPIFIDLLLNGNGLTQSSVVVSKDLLNKVGGYSEKLELITAEDYQVWLEIAKFSDNFKYIPYTLGFYWHGLDNLTSPKKTIVSIKALQKIYAKELQLYGVPGWMYYSFARSFLLLNDYKKSSKYALSAMIKHKSTYIKLKAFATWLEAKYKQLIT